jgi:Carboxypeptidase regulatory-like domain/TonB dependent receptor
MQPKFIKSFLATFFLCLLSQASFAQTGANVSGSVTDINGAAVAGATIKAVSNETGATRSTISDESGSFSFQQLSAGKYQITVTQTGFKSSQLEGFELGVGQSRDVNIILETGDVTAVINIATSEVEPAAIDQSSNRLGVNISAREVEELPVNGRNYSQLYLNAPGATNTGTGNFGDLRFNGRANQQNQTKLDGIESTAIFDASPGYVTVQGSQFRLQTSIENIQEFRVDSSNYPAEYGTGTGGQINVIGKSGGNNFKGSAFYYIRNDALDARNFFDGAEKSPLRLNQFGGSLGGPIVKDKLFFFGSYEGLRQRAGFNIIESTPSTAVRDFVNFYDGDAGDPRGVAARNLLFPSTFAISDADRLRIAALRATGIINAFPVGTGGLFQAGGVNNAAQVIQINRTAQLDEDAFSGRVDYKINDAFTFYGRYQRSSGNLLSPDGTSGRFISAKQTPDNFVASLTQLYGTSIINETKFGINRAPTDLLTVVPAITGLNGVDLTLTSLRLTGNIVSPGVNGGASTGFTEPGGLTRQSSAGNGRAQPIRPSTYSIIDNLSISRGNHNFKFGGEARIIRVNFDQLGGITYSYGNLTDFLLNRNLTAAFIGDLSQPGDFRVATDPITTISRPFDGLSKGRQYYLIGYGQDEWRIRPNITLNYGLRYEYYSVNREKDDRAVIFDAATGKLLPNDTGLYQTAKNNFGPRLGITWAPEFLKGKTVIRAGGGIYYGPGQYEDLIQPIESNVFRSNTTIANGLTTGTSAAVSTIGGTQTRFTPRAYDVNGYRVPERVGQYGISVQQQLPGSTVLTVGYVGSQGRNLFLRSITNRILPGSAVILNGAALPTGVGVITRCAVAPVNGTCPGAISGVTTVREFDVVGRTLDASGNIINSPTSVLQPFGEIDYKTSGGRDHYNGLQIQVNRRFTQGLTINAQYQFSKSYGNTQGSNEAQTAQNPFSFAEEFGNNTFDIRHSGNITALYELPFGKGRKYELNGIANAILGGFQIGGVYNGRAGSPINVFITRPDTVFVCNNAAGCNLGTAPGAAANVGNGFVVNALPTASATVFNSGFIGVINTPGGNASRSTRRPDLIPGVNPFITIGDGNLRYLNPAAFAIPAPGTYGNLPRNFLKGPAFHQFDLTLQKRFPITERVNIEFRSEIYNLFNRANFANPPAVLPNTLGTSASSPQPGQPFSTTNVGQFGVINGTVGRTVGLGTNRQIQFALRLNF